MVSCTLTFFLLARVQDSTGLYCAGALLALTSATVVTGLNSLGSFEAKERPLGEGPRFSYELGVVGTSLGADGVLQSLLVGWMRRLMRWVDVVCWA